MSGAALESYFSALAVLGTCLTVGKLLKTGLFRAYPYFFSYLVINAPVYAALLFLPVTDNWYFYLWEFVQPVAWFLYIGMVFELYRLILARHKGLYTVGRWAMYAGIVVSVTISALTLAPHLSSQSPQGSRVLPYLVAGERGVDFSLAIFLLFMMMILSWYAVPLSRNVVVHAVIYTVYFLSTALGMFLHSLFGVKNVEVFAAGTAAVSAACMLAWFFLLSRKGEQVRVKQPWIGKEQEQRILSQLDSMNAALLRPAGKA